MIATGSLRQKLLDLAVSGELVPQNPNDEAASVWAEKIGAVPVCDGPFELPLGWSWCRLDTLCFSIADGDHQAPPQSDSGIPFLVISNVASGNISFANTRHVEKEYFDSLSCERIPKKGDILVTVTGSYGIVVPVRTEKAFCFQRHIAVLKTKFVENQFLIYSLRSSFVQQYFRDVATGTAQKTVGLAKLRATLIPLPPLEEQKRIVARLEELLALEREIAADGAALDDLVAAARRKILDLAVSGKLVPRQGEWRTVKLDEVCDFVHRGKSPVYCDSSDFPMFAQKCNQPDGIYLNKCKFCVPEKYLKFSDDYKLRDLDVVINSTGTGTLGRVGLFRSQYLEDEGFSSIVADSHVTIVRAGKQICPQYLFYFFRSDIAQRWIESHSDGSTNQKELYTKNLITIDIPLPSLAEQKAIVKRIDELMALLDAMKG